MNRRSKPHQLSRPDTIPLVREAALPAEAPRGVALHLADHPGAKYRLFAVRRDRWGGVGDAAYRALPKLGEAHPDEPALICHAILPWKSRGGDGWEVACIYWSEGVSALETERAA